MSAGDERYAPVNAAWPATVSPCSRYEAERAAKALFRHYGGLQHGSPAMMQPAKFVRVRACWVTRKPSTLYKGWQRLAHDVSHSIFRQRHPNARPHDGGHATLEREIAEFVIRSGWLDGALQPLPVAKATPDDRLAHLDALTARWETKAKRAATALRKLKRKRAALVRRLTTGANDNGEKDRNRGQV